MQPAKDPSALELAFLSKDFRDLCLNESLAQQTLGPQVAGKLKARLADLAAAAFVSEIFGLPGRPRELAGHRVGDVAVDLANGQQLVFQAGHVEARLLPTGVVDWTRVRRIKILGLERDHA